MTIMWKDPYRGPRKHSLMTQKLGRTIPALGETDDQDTSDIVARVKLFSPWTGWTWYITEWDAETGKCFGMVTSPFEEDGEWSYFELSELAATRFLKRVPAVERDKYWQARTIGKVWAGE